MTEAIFNSALAQEEEASNFTVDLERVNNEKVAVIRTSDRNTFRQCRRKWGWSSHLRYNLGPKQNATPLWFGSGFHFAMEDWHGYRRFPSPLAAFEAYVKATLEFNRALVPDDWEEASRMGATMLKYLLLWETRRKDSLLPTYVVDGVPQVEINFRIPIPLDPDFVRRCGYTSVVYSGTIDRILFDSFSDMLWVLDYKSAKAFNTQHFQTDSQITTYCWAASHIYEKHIAGMVYSQHLKADIKLPQPLKSGKISTAMNQRTSHILYKKALIKAYGKVEDAPIENIDYLNMLAEGETERSDVFIRHDYIPRSANMQNSEGQKILMECLDMLNPQLPLYPNPSRDCTSMCTFNSMCVGMDDGSDWEDDLAQNTQQRAKEYDGWRKFIIWPGSEVVEKTEFFDYTSGV